MSGVTWMPLKAVVIQKQSHRQIVIFVFAICRCLTAVPSATAAPDFERDVAPILIDHCLECHHSGKSSGGLNLATEAALLKGGENGSSVVPNSPGTSLLIERITAGEMPPPEKNRRKPLSVTQSATLRDWIASGAKWPQSRELGLHEQTVSIDESRDFWSFQPVRRPPIPSRSGSRQNINPIDAFIEEKLANNGLEPGELATPRQLLRRLSLDLSGLPPSLDEQKQFLESTSSQACDDLVDRLLANQGYGERWARYWLDLVRYADSNGYERDGAKPGVWRYRDYVIDSFNHDKPYDRFVVEQLAGDELGDRTIETFVATGFHALGAWQDEVDPLEAPQYRADELDDMLRTTSQTFLGLTIGCARCHNHKFDPLSMVDYYSLSAILSPLKRPNSGREDRDLPAGTRSEIAAVEDRDRRIAELNRQESEMRSAAEALWLDSGKSKLPSEAISAFRVALKDRNPEQTQLVRKFTFEWNLEVTSELSDERRQQLALIEQTRQSMRREIPDLPRGYFQYEEASIPAPAYLLLSGRASNPGPLVQPAVPVVLARSQPVIAPADGGTSGRRIALAQWIVDPSNPLPARVIVNRVWQHHFGEGIVATSSDFGHIGSRPTHPELLDWLAHWFVHDARWSLKKLHRLIVTSRTYQTTSIATQHQIEIDPENKLLARYRHRRLDVEAIRDSILAASGKLNPEMFGPAVFLPIPASVIEAHTDKDAAWHVSPEPAIFRRTIYSYVKRTLLVPMLEVMDLCDTTNSTEKRSITSIAPQALTLFNGDFVNSQAAYFADRLVREAGSEPEQQIDRAYRLALSRPPSPTERDALIRYLSEKSGEQSINSKNGGPQSALTQMCRVILNLNEFVYVE